MNLHKLVTWAGRILKHSRPGRVREGSLAAKSRQSLDDLPKCKALIRRFLRDVIPLQECQKVIKRKGLSQETYEQCKGLLEDLPQSSPIRKGFKQWAEKHLKMAQVEGFGAVGLPVCSDQIESLFGVAKRHGTGDVKDANRIGMRIPALCGPHITREEVERVQSITVKQQQETMGVGHTLVGQRQRVLAHPENLEELLDSQEQKNFECIPSSKKQSKSLGSLHEIGVLENINGPPQSFKRTG